ncbi:MAG: UvrB/UvrC motif-containing protein [Lachnospiraceae bacterium]|nr:UvrB/UvrC motif-containing protein [Lachnospiraceae bacterium]
MLCEVCKMRDAKICYTEIINGQKREQYLCEECAAKRTSIMKNPFADGSFSLGGLLAGLISKELNKASSGDKRKTEIESKVDADKEELCCSECGMTLKEFRDTGKFGCPNCYKTFEPFFSKNIKIIQATDRHCGKYPKNYKDIAEKAGKEKAEGKAEELSNVEMLSIRLQQAVEREDFEEAAKIRDEIKAEKAVKKPSKAAGAKNKNAASKPAAGKKSVKGAAKMAKSAGNSAEKAEKSVKSVKGAAKTAKSADKSEKSTNKSKEKTSRVKAAKKNKAE